jgi:hypothetical protein
MSLEEGGYESGSEGYGDPSKAPQTPSEEAKVKDILKKVRADKAYFAPDFKQMREDMEIARTGSTPMYVATHYRANLAGRHIKQKTAALYAKNPKAIARRRETMDFLVWDESPQSLNLAMQTMQASRDMLAQVAGAQGVDPMTGQPGSLEIPPEMEQAFLAAQELVQDYQQGMQRRTQIKKVGQTLEILFARALREQKPLDGKMSMKKAVRRALTTGVAYCELGFQREMGPRPGMTEKLADHRARLDHLKSLAERAAKGEGEEGGIAPDDPEIFELQKSIEALTAEPEIVLREGLILDFPQSTRVIPDQLCTSLVGFLGARHLTIEYLYTVDQVREIFGYEMGGSYKGYTIEGKSADESARLVVEDEGGGEGLATLATKSGGGLVCVWKHYDKPSGMVYFVADGCKHFLRPPAAPDVFVEDFWPVYALTFNDVESETRIFPPSDVRLMLDMQEDYNASRQGLREHRMAARPRFAYQKGALEAADVDMLASSKPFDAVGINMPQGASIGDIFQAIPVPGVDQNLYETNSQFQDIQLVVGSSEAQFGGLSKATATESAIAANSTQSSDQSSIDDLDGWLTVIARASGQILLKEMSPEQVTQIVGIGAVWPQMSLAEIADEIYLDVEAGSTGKPNQAVEINNWQQLLPLVMQLPGISPFWLARETLRRLDDRMDLTEALAEGVPSIAAQNQISQVSAQPPQQDPNAQASQGADNAPRPAEQGGSDAAFGSNQV